MAKLQPQHVSQTAGSHVTYVFLIAYVVLVPRFNLNLKIFLVFTLWARENNNAQFSQKL